MRKDCKEEKVSWADYVKIFRSENPDIPDDFYGKWIGVIEKNLIKRPLEKDFNLPTTKEECDQMFSMMTACGIDKAAGITMLKEEKKDLSRP